MEGFYSVLGLSIDISKHSALLHRYENSIATMGDIEQAVYAADAARLAGTYVTYKSRFLIPAPFGSTVLAFIDTVIDELNELRLTIASLSQSPSPLLNSSTSHNDLPITALLRAVVTIAGSDLLKLAPVFETLDWMKSSSVGQQTSQSAALLDELQQRYSLCESSTVFTKLLMRCRQAFVNSLLNELLYGRCLTHPVDNVIANNCLLESSTSSAESFASISRYSLPAFLVNINVPLLCYTDLLSILIKGKCARTNKRMQPHQNNTSFSEESVTSSTHIDEESLSDDTGRELAQCSTPPDAAEAADIFTFGDTSTYLESSGRLLPLLCEVSDTIITFQQEVLPGLFRDSTWPLADVECVRNLLVSINRRLSDALSIERRKIYSQLGILLLQTEAAGNFIQVTARLTDYTMETIELASHLPLDSALSNQSQAHKTLCEDLFTESWFKVRVPLEFVSHMHNIMIYQKLSKHCIESCSSSGPALFERFFRKQLRRIYKRVMRTVRNKDLLRGDYVLLEPSDAIILLTFGALHFHVAEEDLAVERAEYFLGERSQACVTDLSYMCRLSQFTSTSLNCAMRIISRLEKELERQSSKENRGNFSQDTVSEIVTKDVEEAAQREKFLTIRNMNPRRTSISPPFPSITRMLNLMTRFVISHNTYLRGVSLEPLRVSGLLDENSSGDLAIMLKEAHTRCIITRPIKTLINEMLYLCLRACYVIALLCKLSVSFAKYGRHFTYILRDCRELELRFSGMWETLLRDLSAAEQSQGIDASCSMLMTWLPELGASTSWPPPAVHPRPQPADATRTQTDPLDSRPGHPQGPAQTGGKDGLSNLRLGAALGLRKPK